MTTRILVVEDTDDLAFGLRRNLEFDGHDVDVVGDGRTALDRALSGQHDLIVLDLMLPGMDGLTVLTKVRAAEIDTPVLILTALGTEADTVRGLRAGADDYLTKPFGIAEFIARVDALLRRSASAHPERPLTPFRFGSVEVDRAARVVHRDGVEVALAPKEFDLLVALLEADGAARSRHVLLRDVWGHKAAVETRTIDTHVGELRKKLEVDPAKPRHILTVRKFGYRLLTEG
ncbi:MAG: response regulator transcription factor [Gemmatimonadota bacterium]